MRCGGGKNSMERETTAAESLRLMDENARYDAACKRVLSEKIFLAWIMKFCLEEYRDFDVKEIAEKCIEGGIQVSEAAVSPDETNAHLGRIRGANTEDTTLTEGAVYYDIRFYAIVPQCGEVIRLIINVEAQAEFHTGYPLCKRGVYYCCRMVSSQHGTEFTNSHYEKIKKAASIWIVMNPPAERRNTITSYSIREKNLVGNVKEPVRNYDLMTMLMICLGDPGDAENDLLRLLDVILNDTIPVEEKREILENDFDIPMTQTLEGRFSEMCNLSACVEKRGLAKGIAQGREEGREEGRMENTLTSIRNLTKNTGWPIEQAMAALGIPQERWKQLTEQLSE